MTSPRPEVAGTSRRPRLLLAIASIAIALAAADTYVVVLALTDMMEGVGLGIDSLQRATPIISGFLLGYVAVLPFIGRLADLVDRQRVLLGCLAIFCVGSAVTALATDLTVLVAGRVVQGLGGGGLVPATLAIVAATWPAERRGVPLGVVGAVQELGSVLGPVLGALVLAVADWRAIFWLNAIAAVLLGLAIRVVAKAPDLGLSSQNWQGQAQEPGASGARWISPLSWAIGLGLLCLALAAPAVLANDVVLGVPFVNIGQTTSRLATPVGLVASAACVLALALTLRRAWPRLREAGPGGAALLGGVLGCIILTFAAADPAREVVGPLGYALLPLAVLLAIAYAAHHRRSANPVIPHGVVRGRTAWALLVSFLVGTALVAVVVNVPLMARLVHTRDEAQAALVLLRFLLAVPVGALAGGYALRRLGDARVAAIGMACTAIGLAVMTSWGRGAFDTVESFVILALTGLGVGLALAPVNNAALAPVRADAHGAASALVVVARMVGMVVGLALLTAIGLHRYYDIVAALPDPTDKEALKSAALAQVHWVFWGGAIAAGLGALASLGLGSVTRRVTGREARGAEPADVG